VSITTPDGKTETSGDSVLVVNKHKKNDRLADELKGKVKEVHVIGDAMSDKLGYVYGAHTARGAGADNLDQRTRCGSPDLGTHAAGDGSNRGLR